MSRVFVTSEEHHIKQRQYMRSDGDWDNVGKWIGIEDLVSVLDSARNQGPDRFYILRTSERRPLPFGYESLPVRNAWGAGFFSIEELWGGH